MVWASRGLGFQTLLCLFLPSLFITFFKPLVIRESIGQCNDYTDNNEKGNLLILRHSAIALFNIALYGLSTIKKVLISRDVVELV